MNQIEKNSLLIVAGTALFMIMFGIGSIPLLDPDEPVYAETAREMLAAGDFLSPRIFGNFWYDKPPMYYWLSCGTDGLRYLCDDVCRYHKAV